MRKLRNPSVILLIIAILLAGFSVYHTNFARNLDGPDISFEEEEVTASVNVSDEELLKGVKAEDKQDGDVTDSLVVEGLSTFMDDNTRLATYAAFDADGNVAKSTRKVKYKDYVGPQFSLSEPLSFPVGTAKDLQSNLSAFDQIDGDISGSILMYPDTNLDTSIPGNYKVRFEVANSAGDVEELNMTIKIYETDNAEPIRVDLTDYVAYVNLGQSGESSENAEGEDSQKKKTAKNTIKSSEDLVRFIDTVSFNGRKVEVIGTGNESEAAAAAASAARRGSSNIIRAGDIDIDDSEVDYNKPGVYNVTYSYTSNGVTGKGQLTLIVRGEA